MLSGFCGGMAGMGGMGDTYIVYRALMAGGGLGGCQDEVDKLQPEVADLQAHLLESVGTGSCCFERTRIGSVLDMC